ncbi:hypothetical protein H2200_002452 [Cladophialophora chaetospira]|uniref:NmrA-like domain-containing protein n=1 Tax=Cladophialophora chaetospira TaxID=386627 RepID=A0AA39CM54_9EURO|nr:hypothetical protein H2200_002452 [Cladophialophora chaetospira]
MVKVAIAGGSGQVAKEVIDVLLATGKHEITVLSRNEAPLEDSLPGLHWRVVNYDNQADLVEALRGTHTLLSFLQLFSDPEATVQKKLIDAAVAAGVRRFAPSEYGSTGTVNMPWWGGKERTREYLKKVNENGKILEYTFFQPGLFLDYLAFPYKTTKHIDPLQTVFDLENCRAILVEGHEDAIMTLTAAADVAAIVTHAVECEAEWPEIGGISGNRMTFSQIIALGEKVRGRSFTIDQVKSQDLEAGSLNTSWALEKRHQAVSEEQSSDFAKKVSIGILLSSIKGAWDVSDELNQLFPDHKFEKADHFLESVWKGKP